MQCSLQYGNKLLHWETSSNPFWYLRILVYAQEINMSSTCVFYKSSHRTHLLYTLNTVSGLYTIHALCMQKLECTAVTVTSPAFSIMAISGGHDTTHLGLLNKLISMVSMYKCDCMSVT